MTRLGEFMQFFTNWNEFGFIQKKPNFHKTNKIQ